MQRSPWLLLLAGVAVSLLTISLAEAADWPKDVEIAGFTVTGVSGKLNDDGSGRGTGKLKISGKANVPVKLSRSAEGAVKASGSETFPVGPASVDGSFELDGDGLKGSGTVMMGGRPVVDAEYHLTPQGSLNGGGRLQLGSLWVPVSFDIKGSSLLVSGSIARQVSLDTPLAHYAFKGELQLGSSHGSISAKACGTVERRGKVGNAVNTFGPLTEPVNLANGQVSFNIAGVNTNFHLW